MSGPIEESVAPPINRARLGLVFQKKSSVRDGITEKESRRRKYCRIGQLVWISGRKKAHWALFESVGSVSDERGRSKCRI